MNARNTLQTITADLPVFRSPIDKKMFYRRLDEFQCIESYSSTAAGFNLRLRNAQLDDEAIYDLTYLFYRYDLDMAQFQAFGELPDKEWYRHHDNYWHTRVYGSRKRRSTRQRS